MPATFDTPAARRFTEELSERVRRCDNGEGMICTTLDARIKHYVESCAELRDYVSGWAQAVFRDQVAFEPEVESLLKQTARRLLHRAKDVAALGRTMDEQCFKLEGLDALRSFILYFDYLLENWVSPRKSVSPAPRVRIPPAAERQIRERAETLPALPSDWRPSNPAQRAAFEKQHKE